MFTKSKTNEELVILYRDTKNERYLEDLINQNKGLMYVIVEPFVHSIPNAEMEDLIQEAYIPMLRAVDNFDESRGLTFSNLLKVYVRQHLSRLYNSETRKKRYNGTELTSYEELMEINCEKATFDDHSRLDLDDFLESLSGKAKTAAQMLIAGYTKGDVAKSLKCTPATANYYFKRLQKAYTVYMAG